MPEWVKASLHAMLNIVPVHLVRRAKRCAEVRK